MHPFIVEANTQGEILKECLDHYFTEENNDLEQVCEMFKRKSFKRIIFSGMGSSYYAAFSVSGYLTENNIPSVVINAAELADYQSKLIQDDTLLILISQSGESAEVIDVINKVGNRSTILAIVNNSDSSLAKNSDFQLYMHAGYEEFISSKSYLNTLAVLQLLAVSLVDKKDHPFKEKMYELANWIEEYLLKAQEHREEILSFVKGTDIFDFIGNGPSASSVYQAGLIFREGPKCATGSTFCAEYSHGWNLFMKKGTTVVIFEPFKTKESSEEVMGKFVVENNGKLILITSEQEELRANKNILTIRHPKLSGELAPLAQIIPCTMIMGWLLEENTDDN